MADSTVLVGMVMGSASDWPSLEPAAALLQEWGIGVEVSVASAHRSPHRAQAYARDAAARGLKVIIAAAGAAAHLAGVLAAETTLPVIGVPLPSSVPAGVGQPPGHRADAGRGARRHHGPGCGGGPQCRSVCRTDPRPESTPVCRKSSSSTSVIWRPRWSQQNDKIPAGFHPKY